MSWIVIALVGPFLWSIVSHIDKYLLSKYLRHQGIGTLLIYSSLFSIVVLPIIYWFEPNIFNIQYKDIVILVGCGVLNSASIYIYLHALRKDDVSTVVPLFQTIPIFGYFLGFIFLHEILNIQQTAAALIILFGAFFLLIELKGENRFKIKHKVLSLMLVASFLIALHETIFKVIAFRNSFLISIFWQYVGLLLTGIILFMCIKQYRREFIYSLKENGGIIFATNIFSEILTILGNISFAFATLLAPIASIMIINAYQPVFVFIGGILLMKYFPNVATESMDRTHLLKKSISIGIILMGSYMLYQ
jgi:uncharacterized membrane protein